MFDFDEINLEKDGTQDDDNFDADANKEKKGGGSDNNDGDDWDMEENLEDDLEEGEDM